MKRLLALLTALLMLCAALPALAWEVSPEIEALAAAHFPGHGVLDGCVDGDCTALLLTTPAGETRLAFCTEDSAAMTQPLPEMLFWIADAQLYADTAMLLVEDYEGTAYFVGCVRAEEGWVATISTTLPAETEILTASSGRVRLYWTRPAGLGGGRIGYEFMICLQEDGRWLVMETDLDSAKSTMESRVSYYWPFVCTEWRCLHGELLFSRDVAEVLWLSFPMTLENVAAQMDLSGWATLGEKAPLLDAPGGSSLAQFNPGAHLLILGYEDGWVNVAPGGGVVSGWMTAEALFIGSRQLEARGLSPDFCPAVNPYGNALDVYLLPSDAADNTLLIRLEGTEAQYVDELAVWGDGTWTMIHDFAIPGGVGYVHTEQLHAEPEGPLG